MRTISAMIVIAVTMMIVSAVYKDVPGCSGWPNNCYIDSNGNCICSSLDYVKSKLRQRFRK